MGGGACESLKKHTVKKKTKKKQKKKKQKNKKKKPHDLVEGKGGGKNTCWGTAADRPVLLGYIPKNAKKSPHSQSFLLPVLAGVEGV